MQNDAQNYYKNSNSCVNTCVKGSETGFKPLRQPTRFVTFSTMQKFPSAMAIIKCIISFRANESTNWMQQLITGLLFVV